MELAWDDVRVLLALLRTRSLSASARQLGVDRSTISRRVASLEGALGTPLFLRTREGLKPSAAAERLRAHAERAEAELSALARAARASPERVAGTVRVATTELICEGGFATPRAPPPRRDGRQQAPSKGLRPLEPLVAPGWCVQAGVG